MGIISKAGLKFKDNYDWKAAEEDDNPKLTHFPDSALLVRNEGYEVVAFINTFARIHSLKSIASAHKIEDMLQDLPGHIRSRKKVQEWVEANWNKY